MCVSDAAALVLTLCCGARWTSCCSSSRLLLFSNLSRPLQSGQSCTHAFSLYSLLSKNRVTLPLLSLREVERACGVCFRGSLLKPYLFSGGMLVFRLPAALASCCFFSPLSRVVSGADYVPESVFFSTCNVKFLCLSG